MRKVFLETLPQKQNGNIDWKSSSGHIVDFIYDDYVGNFKILSYNLPLLNRKWDIINMDFVIKYTKAEKLRNRVIELLNKGLKQKEIAEICNTSSSNVSKIKKLYEERK